MMTKKSQARSVVRHLAMVWDYAEGNPFSTEQADDWSSVFDGRSIHIDARLRIRSARRNARGSLRNYLLPTRRLHAVLTDPPYYDAIPYSDLSDFFYVWLKRSVGDLFPALFRTPLTPKARKS